MAAMAADQTFAAALSAAMARRSYTLADVRDRLAARGHPVSLTALSYWRSGQRVPLRRTSMEAVPELEAILGLQSRELEGLLPGAQYRQAAPAVPFDVITGSPAAEPLHSGSYLHRAVGHVVVDVGAQRQIERATVRTVAIATRDGVEGDTLFAGDVRNALEEVEVRAIGGCTVVDVRDLDRGYRSLSVEFAEPLQRDEQVMVELELVPREPDLATTYGLVTSQRHEEVLLWVRFHPDCLPSRCWQSFSEGDVSHEWPVELGGRRDLHDRQTNFGPGRLDARWEW